MPLNIALVGNPNSGKTTLFNALTGSNQYVGNWPGVTVEKKEGRLRGDKDVHIVDLPGIYSLSPYTLEEVVARNYLLNDRPDAVINIVDGTNLERNLYLTTQALELGVPVLVAVNMMDVIEKRGDTIDTAELSKRLGCEVMEISALKGTGIVEAAQRIVAIARERGTREIKRVFSDDVETALCAIESRIPESIPPRYKRFYAVKLFERDSKILTQMTDAPDVEDIITAVEKDLDDDAESIITNERYAYITSIIGDCVTRKTTGLSTSDKIDRVVTNRWLSLPIFAIVMFLVYFVSVTTVGSWATNWANDGVFGDGWFLGGGSAAYSEVADGYDSAQSAIEAYQTAASDAGIDPESDSFADDAAAAGVIATFDDYDGDTGANEIVTVDADAYAQAQEIAEPNPSDYGIWVPGLPGLIESGLTAIGCDAQLQALILDGIVAGVGAVLGFVPQMLVLFLLLAFLEYCGYMSRIAFILDKLFHRFGLSGKSFIPILIGTGCGVPGIMASRTIENENDRRMTVMTTTFIPCGAKLPIIALFAGAVFSGVWWVAPSAYFMGIAAILCSGIMLKKTRAFAGDPAPFVMELPAYHWPTIGALLRSMLERASAFIKKAGTIILLATIVIWFISSYGFVNGGFGAVADQNDSLLAIIGSAICWIFLPLGWGNWQATAATITGLIAKENVVGTFGILYAGGAGWFANVQTAFTPITAYSFLAFNLLCAPCFAAMGAIKREMGSARWFWTAVGYECGFAYCVALCIFQIAGLVTGEVALNPFSLVAFALIGLFAYLMLRSKKDYGGQLPVSSVDSATAKAHA